MAIGYTVALRNTRLDAVDDAINAGAGAGKIRIYNGTRPANADTAVTSQVLLAELTMSDPAFPAASAGAMTASAITADASANATGTATWFRVVDSNNNAVVDGDVGTSGSDLNLDTTSIVAGGTVTVTSFVITGGNA